MSAHSQQATADSAQGLPEIDAATARVAATAEALTAEEVRGASLLPGWSRGHVLAHVVANAEGLTRLAEWALTGNETPMYASREARDAEIEEGAGRSGREHAELVARTAQPLRERLVALAEDPEASARVTRLGFGSALPGHQIGHARLRELEIHHVDLAAGYIPNDWSPAFSARALDQLAPFFRDNRDVPVRRVVATGDGLGRNGAWDVADSGPELLGPARELLAWLTGRGSGDNLLLDGLPGTTPPAPTWI